VPKLATHERKEKRSTASRAPTWTCSKGARPAHSWAVEYHYWRAPYGCSLAPWPRLMWWPTGTSRPAANPCRVSI